MALPTSIAGSLYSGLEAPVIPVCETQDQTPICEFPQVDSARPSLEQFISHPEEVLFDFAQTLLGGTEGLLKATTRFKAGSFDTSPVGITIPKSATVRMMIPTEGAQVRKGFDIGLSGFRILGLFPLEQLGFEFDGSVKAQIGQLPFKIGVHSFIEKVLGSSLDKPWTLAQLWQWMKSVQGHEGLSHAPQPESIDLDFNLKPTSIYPQSEPIIASAKAYLNVAQLRENAKDGFSDFDFTGVGDGSYFEWKNFELSKLPLPREIPIQISGLADLRVSYRELDQALQLEVDLKNARIQIPGNCGSIELSGKIILGLSQGGRVRLDVNLNSFQFHLDRFPFQGPASVEGLKATGRLEIHADTYDRQTPLTVSGQMSVSGKGKNWVVKELYVSGSQEFGWKNGNLSLRPETSSLQVLGNVETNLGRSVSVPDLNLNLDQNRLRVTSHQAKLDGKKLPAADLDVAIESGTEGPQLNGALSLQTADRKTKITPQFSIHPKPDGLHWKAILDAPKISGIASTGRVEASGIDRNWELQTIRPFVFNAGAAKASLTIHASPEIGVKSAFDLETIKPISLALDPKFPIQIDSGKWSGKFDIETWWNWLSGEPALYSLTGALNASGAASGKIETSLNGDVKLRQNPGRMPSLQVSLDSGGSRIRTHNLKLKGQTEELTSDLPVFGSAILQLNPFNPKLTWGPMGVSQGNVKQQNGVLVASDVGLEINPVALDLDKGILRAKPNGIQASLSLHPSALLRRTLDPTSNKFQLYYTGSQACWKQKGCLELQDAFLSQPTSSPLDEVASMPLPQAVEVPPEPFRKPILPAAPSMVQTLFDQLDGLEMRMAMELPFEIGGKRLVSRTQVTLLDHGALDSAQVKFDSAYTHVLSNALNEIPIVSGFTKVRVYGVRLEPSDRRVKAEVKYMFVPFEYDIQKMVGLDQIPHQANDLFEMVQKLISKKSGFGLNINPRLDLGKVEVEGRFTNNLLKLGNVTVTLDPKLAKTRRLEVVGGLLKPRVILRGITGLELDHPKGKIRLVNRDAQVESLDVTVALNATTFQPERIEFASYHSDHLSIEAEDVKNPGKQIHLELAQGLDFASGVLDLLGGSPTLSISKVSANQIAFEGYGMNLRSSPGHSTVLDKVKLSFKKGQPQFFAEVQGAMGGEVQYFPTHSQIGKLKIQKVDGKGVIEVATQPDEKYRVRLAGSLKADIEKLGLLVRDPDLQGFVQTEIQNANVTGDGILDIWPSETRIEVRSAVGKSVQVSGKQGRVVFNQNTFGLLPPEEQAKLASYRGRFVSNLDVELSDISFLANTVSMQSVPKSTGVGAALQIKEAEIQKVKITGDAKGVINQKVREGFYLPIPIGQFQKNGTVIPMRDVRFEIGQLVDKTLEGKRRVHFDQVWIEGTSASLCGTDELKLQVGFFEFSPKIGEIDFGQLGRGFLVEKDLGGLGCVSIDQEPLARNANRTRH